MVGGIVLRVLARLAATALPIVADAAGDTVALVDAAFSRTEKETAQGKVALVTGAAGFVGSHVARHCRDLGMTVVALDDLSGGFQSNVPAGVIFVEGDIKNTTMIGEIFGTYRIDYVYHLAAYAAEGLSHFVRSYNYRTNLVASVELLNLAIKHKVDCFVFTSSIAVYGSINDLSQMQNPDRELATSGSKTLAGDVQGLTEEDKPAPEDPYGIAKYAFEMDLRAARELFGIDFVVFRPHNVYGPNQNMFDKYRNVVGIFINQIHHNRPLTIFGDGEQVRAFSYIDDVAPVIARGPLAPEARNEVFNIGGDRPYTINQLASAVKNAMGVPGHPFDSQPARMEVVVAISSHEKAKRYFPAPPTLLLEEGLSRTVSWYKERGKFFTPVEFTSVEVIANLPPSWLRPDLTETLVCQGSRVGGDTIGFARNGTASAEL